MKTYMKRVFKWFRSHAWYEQIIMGIPALIIALIIVWFIFTLVVFSILYAIDYKGDRTHHQHSHYITYDRAA